MSIRRRILTTETLTVSGTTITTRYYTTTTIVRGETSSIEPTTTEILSDILTSTLNSTTTSTLASIRPTYSSPPVSNNSTSTSGISRGTIIKISVCTFVGLIFLAIVAGFTIRRYKHRKRQTIMQARDNNSFFDFSYLQSQNGRKQSSSKYGADIVPVQSHLIKSAMAASTPRLNTSTSALSSPGDSIIINNVYGYKDKPYGSRSTTLLTSHDNDENSIKQDRYPSLSDYGGNDITGLYANDSLINASINTLINPAYGNNQSAITNSTTKQHSTPEQHIPQSPGTVWNSVKQNSSGRLGFTLPTDSPSRTSNKPTTEFIIPTNNSEVGEHGRNETNYSKISIDDQQRYYNPPQLEELLSPTRKKQIPNDFIPGHPYSIPGVHPGYMYINRPNHINKIDGRIHGIDPNQHFVDPYGFGPGFYLLVQPEMNNPDNVRYASLSTPNLNENSVRSIPVPYMMSETPDINSATRISSIAKARYDPTFGISPPFNNAPYLVRGSPSTHTAPTNNPERNRLNPKPSNDQQESQNLTNVERNENQPPQQIPTTAPGLPPYKPV